MHIDPDMLELGAPVIGTFAATSPRGGPNSPPRKSTCSSNDTTKGDTGPRLSMEQGRAEFAAWCTVSAPLILGFDLGNETEVDTWFPVISNKLALEARLYAHFRQDPEFRKSLRPERTHIVVIFWKRLTDFVSVDCVRRCTPIGLGLRGN